MEKEFSELVHNSWNSQLTHVDPMSVLTLKLKRLKETAKAREKNMKQIIDSETRDMDLSIQSLLSINSSGILYVHETTQLSLLKARKDSLLNH